MWSARSALFRLLCGALARVFSCFLRRRRGGGPKKVFPGRIKRRDESQSQRLLSSILFVFFFGPLDLFERYKSYGHIFIYSFVWTNTLLLLLNKKRQKRPTNPTIFSASLTSRLLLADPPLLDDDDFDDFDDFDDVDDECDDDEKKVLPVWRLQTTTEEKRDAIDLSTAGTKK